MTIWGTNFVIVRETLDVLPPFLFVTLRFIFVLLPGALFIPRPKIGWAWLAGYGVANPIGQFGLSYLAMDGHISPGLASLVLQAQVFFTIGLAMAFAGERLHGYQLLALLLATIGIGVIMLHSDQTTTPLGIGLTLIAAAGWAVSNHIVKASGVTEMLGFVIWSSLFAIPPLLLASLTTEGLPAIRAALSHAGVAVWGAVLWQSFANTLFGYAAWSTLLSRYPAATIAPTSMLVPVFGIGASALVLDEPLPPWKLAAAALVMCGLAINMLWPLVGRRASGG